MLRFINRIKNRKIRTSKAKAEVSNCGQFYAVDLNKAETTWIKVVQANSFPKEIEFLSLDRTKTEQLRGCPRKSR